MRERVAKEATTIHSFLAQRNWLNDNLTFRLIGGRREEGKTTFIIDEASMVDLGLIAALFRAINFRTVQRLILVGDPNQLPPIGRGRVFSDIIDWMNSEASEGIGTLKINVRQMENRVTGRGTGILDLASLYVRPNRGQENRTTLIIEQRKRSGKSRRGARPTRTCGSFTGEGQRTSRPSCGVPSFLI